MSETERPTRNDPRVKAYVIEHLAKDCADWEGADGEGQEWSRALARCNLNGNGYDIAKDLDRYCGVMPDAELVEILDGAQSYAWTAHDELIKAWVAENGITPPLDVGARIAWRDKVGVISRIDHGKAQYLLIPDDEQDHFRNGGGYCVAYEQARAA